MDKGYALCLNAWALDKEINGELGLLLIISSLCAEKGYCYASNEYFANLFQEHETTISRKIKKLSVKGYITIEYEKRGAEVKNRKIRLANLLTDDYQSCYSTISKNAKENNISINNTSINNKENIKRKFSKPTLEEVEEYVKERKSGIDPKVFFDYYEVNNWKDIKNWKQKLITWESHQHKNKEELPSWSTKETQTSVSEEEEKEFQELLNSFH